MVRQVAAMRVPFLVTDTGGMAELVDMGTFWEAVVPEATPARLAAQLQTVLERGYLPILQLLPQVWPSNSNRTCMSVRRRLPSAQGPCAGALHH
jgi:hypothetical protein